jgi:hypothetical protein
VCVHVGRRKDGAWKQREARPCLAASAHSIAAGGPRQSYGGASVRATVMDGSMACWNRVNQGFWAGTRGERISPPPTASSSGSALCLEALGQDVMGQQLGAGLRARSGTDWSRCADVIRLLQPGHHRTDALDDGLPGSHIQRRRCNGDCCSQRIPWHHPLHSTQPRTRRRPESWRASTEHTGRELPPAPHDRPPSVGRPSSRFALKCPGRDAMSKRAPADTH